VAFWAEQKRVVRKKMEDISYSRPILTLRFNVPAFKKTEKE